MSPASPCHQHSPEARIGGDSSHFWGLLQPQAEAGPQSLQQGPALAAGLLPGQHHPLQVPQREARIPENPEIPPSPSP